MSDPSRVGDTPRTDPEPALVDTRQELAETGRILSDTPRTDPEPALVDSLELKWPTAGELRAAGVKVDAKYRDDVVPGEYQLDQARTDPEPALVREYGPTLPARVPGRKVEKAEAPEPKPRVTRTATKAG